MKVKNKTGTAHTIAATGQTVDPGATAEVDDTLGESLLEQVDVWGTPTAKKSKTQEADKP